MANALALPSSTGTTADPNKPAELPKVATPKPQAQPPLALAGSMGGQSAAQSVAPVPVPQTADPLAFASTPTPGAATAPISPTPANPAPTAAPAPAPNPYAGFTGTESAEEMQKQSLLAGKTDAEKLAISLANARLAPPPAGGQDYSQFRATADQTIGPDGRAINTANPEKIAQVEKLIGTVGQQGIRDQQTARAATDAGTLGANADQRLQDWNTNAAWNASHFGVTPDPEKAKAEFLAGGAGAVQPQAGTNLGDTTTIVPGFGEPTRPVPQDRPAGSGSPVDPATAIANQATGGGGNNVALSQIDPENSLISQQITPGQNIDRVKTFQDALNSTVKNVIDPAYATSARNLNRYNFGQGRGVSGAARTSQGDLASERERRIADLSAQGIADATRGSIDDNYRNIDETQQERDYQKGLGDTAFDQDAQLALIREQLTNGAFGRAERQNTAGQANSPDDIGLILSKIFGDQSSAAARAAAESFKNAGSGGGGGGGGSNSVADILALIQKLKGGGQQPVQTGVDNVDYGGAIPS